MYFFLSELIVEKDRELIKHLKENICRIFMKFIRSSRIADSWQFLNEYKVPSSKVLEGLYRYKEKVVKGKKKSVPKKPKRPSKRIEVIYPEERLFIDMYEGCFIEFNNLTTRLKAGVAFSECEKEYLAAAGLTSKKWEIVKRFSAPLSYRRKVLLKMSKELKLKQGLTKANIKIILQAVLDREVEISKNEIVDLSSYNIINAGKGMTRMSNGFKNILLKKDINLSLKKIHESDNYETFLDLLKSNLEFIYSEEARPDITTFQYDHSVVEEKTKILDEDDDQDDHDTESN